MDKPEILVFVDWFWPGYLAGGPVQSIISLVTYLGDEFRFKIVTTDSDLNSKTPYPGIIADKWQRSELGCEVFYISRNNLTKETIDRLIRETSFDLVYINSFFSKFFSIVPLQLLKQRKNDIPVIIAPRGMLGEGALALKKWKKKAFLVYSKLTGLHHKLIWHTTSEQEEKEVVKVMGNKQRIFIVSNLPRKLSASTKEKKPGALKLCFISRISEKKNLVYALDILAGIKEGEISYHIYGPKEDELYWQRCQEKIGKLPSNISVTYKGSVNPEQMENVLSGEQVLLLPTLNENFGHSIVESLMGGCPAIISDQTPWNDLEAQNAGYAISLGQPEAFLKALCRYRDMDQAAFSAASEAAIKYISSKINIPAIKEHYKRMFNESIKNRSVNIQ